MHLYVILQIALRMSKQSKVGSGIPYALFRRTIMLRSKNLTWWLFWEEQLKLLSDSLAAP